MEEADEQEAEAEALIAWSAQMRSLRGPSTQIQGSYPKSSPEYPYLVRLDPGARIQEKPFKKDA